MTPTKSTLPHVITSLIVAALVALLPACSTTEKRSKPYDLIDNDHPLTGKIWSVRDQRVVDQQQLKESILRSQYILLGETHDNQEHHKHQQWIIDTVIKNRDSVGVAFEMISTSQAELIKKEATKSGKPLDADKLIDLLNQEKSGWQYRLYYKSIFDSVLNAGLPLHPANLDRDKLLKLLRSGEDKLPANIKTQLDNNPISPSLKAILTEEIKNSHCGMANPGMVDAMMLGQRVRDIIMSDSLFENRSGEAEDKPVMLFVGGSGHTRKDRGIPVYLQQHENSANILSMAWIEVVDEGQQVSDYAGFWGTDTLPFDYVWFTAHVDRPDPCEQMRRYMEKHQEHKGAS